MFQNISESDIENDEKIESIKKEEKLQRIKKMFSIRNCMYYIISLLISTVPLGNFIAPFGFSIFAAASSNEIPVMVTFVVSAIGVAIRFGKEGLLTYILTALIFIFEIIVFKPNIDEDRNEKKKLGMHLFFAVFIVQAGSLIFRGFYFYNILMCIAYSLITFIFYKIFSNGIFLIREYGEKTAFTIEEIMAASVMLAITFSAFGNFQILGLSVKNVACIFMVLALGWKNGVLVGGTSGITIGVLLGIIGHENPGLIGAYALSRNDSRTFK